MASYPSGTVTFLFTDIEGSTKLARAHPETWEDARMRHHTILREAIEGNNGYIFQIIGDAFCAAFHTAGSALKAAIQIQQQLETDSWDDAVIRVRIGIHTNEAELNEDGQYQGYLTLSLVQRIMSAGYGGQILVTQAAYDLAHETLSPDVELRDLGQHRFKDFPQTQRVYQLVAPGLIKDFPPLKTLADSPNNLPLQSTPFIGRAAELSSLIGWMADPAMRLVTIIGPGGMGKTRLSIETARASLTGFPDGVWFVALAPFSDPNLIVSAITQALGYVGPKNTSTTEQLQEGIDDKSLLLILDNCEHIIEAVALLASELLSACPRLKILATSREPLRIPGEWVYALPAFELPADAASLDAESVARYPALTLFAERARAVRSDFALTANNIQAVAAICARLDGLPLAIELTAARVRLMSPQALLERLNPQFILNTDGVRGASERQKTLHNAIDWSYNLLLPEEQRLFAFLSVFSGSFTLDAAEATFSHAISGKPVPDLVASLLDKSLLKLAPELEGRTEARFSMLMTIREYARERLRIMGEETEIRNLHLAYFMQVAETAGKELSGPNQPEWLDHLDAVRDDLRAALDWAIEAWRTEAALQVVRSLHWFWIIRSNFDEARQWFRRVLEMPDTPLHPEAYAEVLAQMAHHTFLQLTPRDAGPYAEQALSIARAHNDRHNIARALVMLGIARQDGQNAVAQSALEESQLLFREVQDELGYSFATMVYATLFWPQEDWTAALSLSQQARAGFQKAGHPYLQAVTTRHIGIAYVHLGDLANGSAALRDSLILARQLNSKHDMAQALLRFAEIAKRLDQHVHAVHLFWATRKITESIGAWQQEDEAWFENHLAPCRAALSASEFAEAVEEGRAMTMEQAITYALQGSANE